MKRATQRGQNQFQESWLSKYSWVKKKSSTHVTCTICHSDLSFANMGESALKAHAKPNPIGKAPTKHQKLAEENVKAGRSLSVLHFVDPREQSSSQLQVDQSATPTSHGGLSNTASPQEMSSQASLDMYVIPIAIAEAEIRWVMKVVLSHFSLRSNLDIKELFCCMFPDSEIAKRVSMSKTKCAYFINFGLAPYYKQRLVNSVKESPFYALLFDESLNRVIQTEQMDVVVRYWCGEKNRVQTKYFDSQFFNRANAANIVGGIENALRDVSKEGLIHIGMDGPKTNWSVLDAIQQNRKDGGLTVLENLGSCGLHIVSGALGTGVLRSSWPLKKVLKSMFNFFNDAPARRDVYIMLNESSIFPDRFCATRWVENEPVAERAVQTWDKTMNVIKHFSNQPPSKRPKDNSSFECLVVNRQDVLMKVKIQVFKDIAQKTNMFLTVFQTDAPMVPFMSDSLEELLRRLMGYFISKPILESAATPLSLVKLDVSATGGKCLPLIDLKLPTASKAMLKKLGLSIGAKTSFLNQYRDFLIGMVEKLQERCPLKFAIVRCAASLDPVKMADNPTQALQLFEGLVDVVFNHGRITANEADSAKAQFECFLNDVVRPHKDAFRKFDFKESRLDEFFALYMVGEKRYVRLFKIVKFVCVLSHGQAPIERGFNVNKEVQVENLMKESLISQRIVYDQLRSSESKIHEIPIPRQLILSCKSAHQRYAQSLEEKRKVSGDEQKSQKRKLKQEEIICVKRQKSDVEHAVVALKAEIEQFSVEAATKPTFESMKLCLEKANSFREVLKTKAKVLSDLEDVTAKLEEELKKI